MIPVRKYWTKPYSGTK